MLRGARKPGDRWTEHDTSMAVALTLHEASLCPGCGHPLGESASGEADPSNRDGQWWYEAPAPVECHACKAVGVRVAEFKDVSEERRGALRFYAEKHHVDDPEPDQ